MSGKVYLSYTRVSLEIVCGWLLEDSYRTNTALDKKEYKKQRHIGRGKEKLSTKEEAIRTSKNRGRLIISHHFFSQ